MSFSLPWELVLQLVLAVLVFMASVSIGQKQDADQKRFWMALLSIALFTLLVATVRNLYDERSSIDPSYQLRSLILLFWLPFMAFPFIYGIALAANYELAFMHMKFANNSHPARMTSRLALIVGLNVQIHYVHKFAGSWAAKVGAAQTFSAALKSVREFRIHIVQEHAKEKERQIQLVRLAGTKSTDAAGHQLDQREFS